MVQPAVVHSAYMHLKKWITRVLPTKNARGQSPGARLLFEEIEEQAVWLHSLQTLQLSKDGLEPVLQGIQSRHGPIHSVRSHSLGSHGGGCNSLLRLLHMHRGLFLPGSPGQTCVSAAMYTACQSAEHRLSSQEIVRAVRAEIQAQIADACN